MPEPVVDAFSPKFIFFKVMSKTMRLISASESPPAFFYSTIALVPFMKIFDYFALACFSE